MANRIELRSYCTENRSHAHDFAQLLLPLAGSMELEAGSYLGIVDERVGIYIAPGEQHSFAGSEHNLFLVLDLFSTGSLPAYHFKSHSFQISNSTKKLIQFIQHYLLEEENNFFTDSLINQLLLHFSLGAIPIEQDAVVVKAKNWIDDYFTEPVEVAKVAGFCHLSISQLQRRFKQTMGCSIAVYWRLKKLHYAKQLLARNHLPVETVAFKVGYENLSAFSRCFNKLMGESPSQWRTRTLMANNMRQMDKTV